MILRIIILSIKWLFFCLLVGLAIVLYLLNHYNRDLPDYSQLKKYYPPSITRMYSSDGKLIEEFAKEHRIFIPIESIPQHLIEAFIAAEDKNFYSHDGIDIFSIIRAYENSILKI